MKNPVLTIIRVVEVGEAQFLVRLVPLAATLLVMAALYTFTVYHGLSDAQSMDNAQLARQIVRGEGYTTRFLRPQAISELRSHTVSQHLLDGGSGQLFPSEKFPPGAARVLPDTYNAPGYPCLLAAWFKLVQPNFDQKISPDLQGYAGTIKGNFKYIYPGDRWIPLLNMILTVLTGLLVYFMARRLYDDRVAWFSVVAFFATDLVWEYSLTGLSTSFLMFLVTGVIFCALEIFCISENCFESEESTFWLAWVWAIVLSLLLAAACLTRLHLLILLPLLLTLFFLMPRPSWLMSLAIGLAVIALVTPWFVYMFKVSGNPLGSNMSLLLYGTQAYKDNQIFCATSIPSYERLLKYVSEKETTGFLWHFEYGWHLLGANPMILLFAASLMHAYKRRRALMFQWLLVGLALAIVLANNLGVAQPEAIDAWNTLVVLFPSMVVVGSAFFFVQLDRLNLQVWLVNNLIVIFALAITAMPVGIALTSPSPFLYAFPPYMPPLINVIAQYAQPDEWVTTDMPWATAWYANRASLWLPDSVDDFIKFNDDLCPSGLILLTPVTWSKPADNLLNGEDREWLSFATGATPPSSFPLAVHTITPPGGPEYNIWSDRPRWQSQ